MTAEQVMQELVAMRTELARQREENIRLKAEQGAALEAVRTESAARVAEMQAQAQQAVQQATAQMGTMPQLLTEMVKSNKELVEAMAKKESPGEKLQLVDNKGLGKPTTFSGEHEQFLPWRHRMASYVCSIHQDLREVLEWLEEREKPFSSEELDAAFGERAPDAEGARERASDGYLKGAIYDRVQLPEQRVRGMEAPYEAIRSCHREQEAHDAAGDNISAEAEA